MGLEVEDEVMTQFGQGNADFEGPCRVFWAGKLALCGFLTSRSTYSYKFCG